MPSSLAAGPASNAEPSPLQHEWLPLPCPGPGSFLSYGLLLETVRPKRMSGIWLRLLLRVTPLSVIAAASCSLSPMPLFPASSCPIPCAGPLGPLLFPVEKILPRAFSTAASFCLFKPQLCREGHHSIILF